jgi:putative tryptophan/tyrosine transport system substrate-binding protein
MLPRFTCVLALCAHTAELSAQTKTPTQTPASTPRIAMIHNGYRDVSGASYDALREGMRELGYMEGRNVIYDVRWAEGRLERLPDIARAVVAHKPAVIVVGGTPATTAAKAATSTIPIVMASVGDPVGAGFIASLARPAGNITGIAIMADTLVSKELELLRQLVPGATRITVLHNSTNRSYASILKAMDVAATKLGVRLLRVDVTHADRLESGLAEVAAQRPDALIVSSDGIFTSQQKIIIPFAARNRIPALYSTSTQVAAGGLVSYASNVEWRYRRAATFVDKILKGANPGDLPAEQPTGVELVINLKTAKALGLTIPQELLLRANKVIE